MEVGSGAGVVTDGGAGTGGGAGREEMDVAGPLLSSGSQVLCPFLVRTVKGRTAVRMNTSATRACRKGTQHGLGVQEGFQEHEINAET